MEVQVLHSPPKNIWGISSMVERSDVSIKHNMIEKGDDEAHILKM